jgi:lysophospholipase L1-like esterase
MRIKESDTILFTGDSITDCGRDRADPLSLGNGYAFILASRLQAKLRSPSLRIFNRGVAGDRVQDLEGRLETDILALQPTVVSILIGINDTWRRYDSGVRSQIRDFKTAYSHILRQVHEELESRIILLEPFLLPVPDDRRTWREDLNPRIDAVRELAVEHRAELLPLDGIFAAAATQAPASFWLPDGVHPSAAGHALIADAWMRTVAK